MHQVLSYETAVRANSSSEYREYVTKRTCISLVLTIAFFTLISGYLLGNFVSERKNHIRMLLTKKPPNVASDPSKDVTSEHTIDISSTDYMCLQELHAHQKVKSKLLASAQNLSKLQQGDEAIRSSSLNTDIYSRYISCTQDVSVNATTNDLSHFIEQLIDNTLARQKECIHRIQAIIDHNLN
ncbi:uncharacterized protein LOC133328738 [Musca vetustissima]|uniref:uncharacterized protein LOC133322533 n=1 Tax=Musca vetustissima TaxID=27455 RepID=UPI002AB6B84A|nr:uncharacterized protein LOC133322533 [Musca vetustissima]XP_061393268.1 uncharacterized protein LOC133328738 [Musca vetustissima]